MASGGGISGARNLMRKEDERIRRAHERHRRRIARKARRIAQENCALQERTGQLEDDLGRVLLLAIAANKLLRNKHVLSEKGIAEVAKHVDMWDGRRDAALDPAVLRPEDQQPRQSKVSPEEFLKRLEDDG